MSPLAVQLIRRLAASALALAVLLLVVPRLLMELGVIGPGVGGDLEAAARAVEVARAYGASDGLAPLSDAERDLALARSLLAQGKGREARKAAARARREAIEAQQRALANRDDRRRRAEAIVGEVDRQLNDLEDLYSQVTPGLGKTEVAGLLSLMKTARQTGAGLVLAYQQGNYDKVIAEERSVRESLAEVGLTLGSARRPGSSGPR